MAATTNPNEHLLLRTNLKQLRLPTMGSEFAKLAREAATANQGYEQYLLRLTELEVAARHTNALRGRIKQAGFPVIKDLDSFDFTATPTLNKQKVLELTRPQWIDEHVNACLIGNAGTGKTHVAIALGLAACRHGKRVRFFTAAHLVNQLEEAQKQYQLDRFLARLDKTDLLVVDELGYLNSLDSVSTLRRLVAFYVEEHNTRLPHSAFRGQTPDEMYCGTGSSIPDELAAAREAARQSRMEVNRTASCPTCDLEMVPLN